ncbi:PAS domain-containing sensor histidine kinase [Clostridium sp. B9]|uniref:sensor histidine kinase n=1 Tax=Clostridium sp. B9 TaxID=3423224 RepID=UPI003D2EBD62
MKDFQGILETCPMDYIYCVMDQRESVKALIINDSNIKEIIGECLESLLEKSNNLRELKEIYYEMLNDIENIGEYKSNFLSAKRYKEGLIIWIDRFYLKDFVKKESKFRYEKKMLDLFLDSLTDYVFFKDIAGKYLNCNKAFANKIGLDKKEILGKTDKEIFSRDLYRAEMFFKTDRDVIEAKEKRVYGDKCELGNGVIALEETIKAPYFDENYEIKGIIGLTRDISYKKAIENRIHENDIMFFEVLNYLDDVVIIKEGKKTLYVNEAFEKLYGINCKELYNEECLLVQEERIHPDDRHKFRNIDFTDFFSQKARIIRIDNEVRTVWFRANSIKNENGDSIRRIIVINDITDNISEENKIEKLKMEFFANISHEFKTPVNLIFSVFQLLELKLDNSNIDFKEYYKKYINAGKENVFRLLKLINNLIDSTKLESGFLKCHMKNYEIVSYIEDLTLSICDFAKKNKVSIVFDTEEEEKIVAFDINHMERIILNLLSNAIKFNKENGVIIVNLTFDNEYANISIKDSGIGIPKDKIQSLFDRFKIINNRLTKINEGSGMGLFIVKELVLLHNGKIEVKSELGEGSEFIIKIPLVQVNNEAFDEVALTLYDNGRRRDRYKIELSDIYSH